jgi:hypothetical protein
MSDRASGSSYARIGIVQLEAAAPHTQAIRAVLREAITRIHEV